MLANMALVLAVVVAVQCKCERMHPRLVKLQNFPASWLEVSTAAEQVKDEFVGSRVMARKTAACFFKRGYRVCGSLCGESPSSLVSGLTTTCQGSGALEHWLWSRQRS